MSSHLFTTAGLVERILVDFRISPTLISRHPPAWHAAGPQMAALQRDSGVRDMNVGGEEEYGQNVSQSAMFVMIPLATYQ